MCKIWAHAGLAWPMCSTSTNPRLAWRCGRPSILENPISPFAESSAVLELSLTYSLYSTYSLLQPKQYQYWYWCICICCLDKEGEWQAAAFQVNSFYRFGFSWFALDGTFKFSFVLQMAFWSFSFGIHMKTSISGIVNFIGCVMRSISFASPW